MPDQESIFYLLVMSARANNHRVLRYQVQVIHFSDSIYSPLLVFFIISIHDLKKDQKEFTLENKKERNTMQQDTINMSQMLTELQDAPGNEQRVRDYMTDELKKYSDEILND